MKVHMPDPYFLEQGHFNFPVCGCAGNPQAFSVNEAKVTCENCLRRIEACRKIREEFRGDKVVMRKKVVRGNV